MTKPDMMLWLDDHRGIYIPRDFATSFAERAKDVSGVSAEDWAILEAGPDHEAYWDTWAYVCDHARVTDHNGVGYLLYQDGALWLIPEGMVWSDDADGWFVWPDEVEDDPDAHLIGTPWDHWRGNVAALLDCTPVEVSGMAGAYEAEGQEYDVQD